MKTILVNVSPEETRLAEVEDDTLLAVEVERPMHLHQVGNIYKGRVQKVLPGMQAAFVDIGQEKNAYMYIGGGLQAGSLEKNGAAAKIHEGQIIAVQIVKDAAGTKGPRATTHLTLPGRNVVLLPTSAYIAISKRIEDEEERSRLKKIAEGLCPAGMGLIVRTAAQGQSEEVLSADIRYLCRLWESLLARNRLKAVPVLLYRDADLIIRIVRDSFTEDVDRMIIDDKVVSERVKELLEDTLPELADRVELYEGREPLFARYGIDSEFANVGARKVELPSGGFIVIDKTEALTAIDVNTGKYVGNANLADTVYSTNLEAAKEIIKQIRLRDISGIIIVDFIDMEKQEQQEKLLAFMREAVKRDRTKTKIVDITPLGLVEITRKKTRQNLESIIYSDCPYCQGRGRVESPETIGIRIAGKLREIEAKNHAAHGYEVCVHEEVASCLQASGLLKQLGRELSAAVDIVVQPGIHPESFSILEKQ